MHSCLAAMGRICQHGWDSVKPCLRSDALNQSELNINMTETLNALMWLWLSWLLHQESNRSRCKLKHIEQYRDRMLGLPSCPNLHKYCKHKIPSLCGWGRGKYLVNQQLHGKKCTNTKCSWKPVSGNLLILLVCDRLQGCSHQESLI